MAFGGPDWETRIAKIALPVRNTNASQSISAVSFGGSIGAGVTGSIDVSSPGAGLEEIFDSLVISVDVGTARHFVDIIKISDSALLFQAYWENILIVELETTDIPNGQQARMRIINNDSVTRDFQGMINYLEVLED